MNKANRHATAQEAVARGSVLLTTEQAAVWANIQPRTLITMSKEGRAPKPIRLSSRCTRWDLAELEQWKDSLRDRGDDAA